ncbi:MAG: SIS domain-containing protein, partial [Elusimicrobiota bacterium]|nr:SIS domain-containing protein [Elusimicrobiota bacterium]
MKEVIEELIQSSLQAKQSMLCDTQIDAIYKICQKIEQTYKNGAKTLICGNGGSASDALHFSAEI